jgi:ubiquinone/menaquinone biosynthesis C-methylase UbiE
VYDLAQIAAGARTVRGKIAEQVSHLRGAPLVLDIGGGTGAVGAMWDARTKYVCLDIDPLKLEGFLTRNPKGIALQGDATQLPIGDASLDVVLCNSVTHHLTDDLLAAMVAEVARVLRPGGRLILTDAVWAEKRWAGKMIWRYDRGSFPRTCDVLKKLIASHLSIERWEHFSVWHEYVLCVASRRLPQETP